MDEKQKARRILMTVAFAAASLVGGASAKYLPASVNAKGAEERARAAVSQPAPNDGQVLLVANSSDAATVSTGHVSHASHASHASHRSHASHYSSGA
jgi:hypothetical protein